MGQSVLSILMHSVFLISLRFIYSPWRPVVRRTDRQEKDWNSNGLARDRKWDGRPPKPGGLNRWGSRRSPAAPFWYRVLGREGRGKGRGHGLASHFSCSMKRESGGCRNMSHSLSELFELRKLSAAEFPFPLCTIETGSWWAEAAWLLHTDSSGSSWVGIQVSSSSSDGSVLVPRQHHSLQSRRPALQSRQGWQLPCAGQWVNCFGICTLRAVSTAFNLALHADTFVPACAGCYPLHPLQDRGKRPLYSLGRWNPHQSMAGFSWLGHRVGKGWEQCQAEQTHILLLLYCSRYSCPWFKRRE